jgi:chemotaxis response regulator CheB
MSAALKIFGVAVMAVMKSARASTRAVSAFVKFMHSSARRRVRQRLQNVLDAMVDWLDRGMSLCANQLIVAPTDMILISGIAEDAVDLV